MKTNFPILTLWVFTAVTLFAAYGALAVHAQTTSQAITKAADYETVLGKTLNDDEVDDFIFSNGCASQGQFQVCSDAGVALWIGLDQKVETVYLYPSTIQGFGAYKGKLPFGLSPRDTRANVEDKLGQPKVERVPQAGWVPGLPDESATPDHTHDWAVYKRFGVTIIYNSPSATDKGASIYAVVVGK